MTEHSTKADPDSGQTPPTEYKFENQALRIVIQDDGPWFIAKDVCNILGLNNGYQTIAHLDADKKGVHLLDPLGSPQNLIAVNETGVFNLALRSKTAARSRIFLKWFAGDVLPAIRKNGKNQRPRN